MATTETFRATAGISTLNSGSELYKLAKMGSNASSHAQSDVEVAHMEAQFTGPDLLDSAKELLQINENEEAERKALLDSMQAYDEILTRIDRKASAKSDGGLSDTHTQSTHGQDFDSAQGASAGFDVLDSAAGRSIQPMIHNHDSFGPHHGLHFVGEDDEEELLCDYAPNSALQDDGTVGIVGEDGEVSLPVTPSLGRSGSYKVNHGPTDAQKRAMMMGRSMLATQNSFGGYRGAYGGYDEEPCLSDSWHATETSDASITALRRQYHTVFGKETSSNNRQWLLRRLAEINSYGGDDASDDAGDFHSGNGEGGSDGEDGSPFTSASAGTHDGRFFSVGDSEKKMGVPRGVVGRGRAAEKAAAPVVRGASARGKTEKSDGRRGPKVKRGRGDSDSADGGAAKTDASAAGKKRKGGHHSDSEDHSGEPPVKSGRKPAGRKGADAPGANGRRSKHHNPWALEEAEALVEGVARCGGGKWADIKKLNYPAIEHRTAVDLKDKWRNLLRIAMLPHQPVKSAGDKKREIPPELLARVRELAAKQAKKVAQDGRSRNGGR